MDQVNKYLNHLNEDFSFVNKVFKGNVIAKAAKGVKDSVKGNSVNQAALDKALKPIPAIEPAKIDIFLGKYLPNFKHNKMVALKHFNKKHPAKKHNDTMATVSGMIASADDKNSVQDSIKMTDKVYSYNNGSFVLMLIRLFASVDAFSLDQSDFKQRAMVFALGALLIIKSFRSLID